MIITGRSMSKRKPTVRTYFGQMVKLKVTQSIGQIVGVEIRDKNTQYIVRTVENDASVETRVSLREFVFIGEGEREIGFKY